MTRKAKAVIKGGKKIGEGVFGQVYRPPLHCLTEKPHFNNDEYVSKVVSSDDAIKEMDASDALIDIDPDFEWSERGLHMCTTGVKQTNKNYKEETASGTTQVIYRYAGVDFGKLICSSGDYLQFLQNSVNFGLLSRKGFLLVIKLIKGLLPHIRKMNDVGYHCDLHFGNIVYNRNDTKARLIDFGQWSTRSDMYKLVTNKWRSRLTEYGLKGAALPYLLNDIEPLIFNESETTDINTVYRSLLTVINSAWGKQEFKNEFKHWRLNQIRAPHTYDEYYKAILDIPAI